MQDATMITFDANGTLFQSRYASMEAFTKALYDKAEVDAGESGLFYSESTTSDYTTLFNGFLKEYGSQYPKLLEICPQDFSDVAWKLQAGMKTPSLYDDVIDTLELVKNNMLYLVSRAPQEILDRRVDENGIRHYFTGIRSVYKGHGKEKEVLNLGAAPYKRSIFVGDEYDDMGIVRGYNSRAKSGNMIGVAIMRPDEWNNRDPKDMRAAGADYIIGDLRELGKIAHAA